MRTQCRRHVDPRAATGSFEPASFVTAADWRGGADYFDTCSAPAEIVTMLANPTSAGEIGEYGGYLARLTRPTIAI
ncbi:hypothetical protein A5706_24060 [Mycobacterium sp. E796]|nr:hypothetical protein A5706_24060 [Mycobacterium sp. E796]